MQEHGPRGRIFTRQSVERDSNADTLPGLNLSGCLSARFARFHRAYLSAKISRAGGSAKRERPARTVSPPENTGSGRQIKRETRQRGNESPVDNPNRESKFNDPRSRLSNASPRHSSCNISGFSSRGCDSDRMQADFWLGWLELKFTVCADIVTCDREVSMYCDASYFLRIPQVRH